jgi:RNA polymerase sigma-70 factor, ECF subfamily
MDVSRGSGQREAALLELHDRYASELLRFAMWRTRDRQLSEDIVQEVLLRAWKDPGLGQRDQAAARAWLFTASRNLITDRWRSAASRYEQRMEDPPEKRAGDATSLVLDRWLLAEALASLSTEQHSVINAVYDDRRYLCPAPQPRRNRQVTAALRTQNPQIGPTGERSDPAVNAVPDKFAQWDAVSRPRISSLQLAGM